MPKGRPKKQQEEFEEMEEPEEEETEEPEIPPMPKAKEKKVLFESEEEQLEKERQEIEEKLSKIKSEKLRTQFLEVAPLKIEELEKRIFTLETTLAKVQDNFRLLIESEK